MVSRMLMSTDSKSTGVGVALAAGAVTLVGGSVAASSILGGYPVLGGQGVRYAAAALLLATYARLRRSRLRRPVGPEWGWLLGLAAVGLAGCSVLLIEATRVADPAAVGVVVGAAPLLIAVIGPAVNGRSPAAHVLIAAGVVALGAALAQLSGSSAKGWSAGGLLLSIGALIGVAGTSLLAAPVLPRLGALSVSTYSCALAAGLLLLAAAATHLVDGSPMVRPPARSELAALAYLAVAVTAVVFGAWFAAVHRLGVERAGLFNGLIPVASLAAITLVGAGAATRAQLVGALTVLVGLLLGLTGNRPRTVRLPRALNHNRVGDGDGGDLGSHL